MLKLLRKLFRREPKTKPATTTLRHSDIRTSRQAKGLPSRDSSRTCSGDYHGDLRHPLNPANPLYSYDQDCNREPARAGRDTVSWGSDDSPASSTHDSSSSPTYD